MRVLRSLFLVAALLAGCGPGVAQGLAASGTAVGVRVVGAVNGQPLRVSDDRTMAITKFRLVHHREPSTAADRQEIDAAVAQTQCSGLQTTILAAAKATQMTTLGVRAAPEEITALKAEYLKEHDLEAETKKDRDDAVALVAALTDVYERGMDQDAAYQKYLAARSYDKAVWEANLIPGKSPEWRASHLRSAGVITAKAVADALDPVMAKIVERHKLDAAVDQEIAAGDPTFRAYQQDEARNTVKLGFERFKGPRMSIDQGDYLRLKRAEWWRAREAEVNLVLNDQALGQRCGIVPGRPASPLPAPRRPLGPPPGTAVPITVTPVGPVK